MIDWLINWLKVWIIDILIIRNGPKTPGWCRSQFLIPRHLTFAQDVRKQLVGICHNAGQSTFQLLNRKQYFFLNSSFCLIFSTKNYLPLTFLNSAFYALLARFLALILGFKLNSYLFAQFIILLVSVFIMGILNFCSIILKEEYFLILTVQKDLSCGHLRSQKTIRHDRSNHLFDVLRLLIDLGSRFFPKFKIFKVLFWFSEDLEVSLYLKNA